MNPTHPATDFGYLELGEEVGPRDQGGQFRRVRRFVEKPDAATAQRLRRRAAYAWNAGDVRVAGGGLPVARRDARARARHIHPGIPRGQSRGLPAARFPALPKISIDYAIMEKAAGKVATLVAEFDWDDVGTWTALPQAPGDRLPPETPCAGPAGGGRLLGQHRGQQRPA